VQLNVIIDGVIVKTILPAEKALMKACEAFPRISPVG
jgi:hypothetical protein